MKKINKTRKEKQREYAEKRRRIKGIQPRKKFNSEEEKKEAKRKWDEKYRKNHKKQIKKYYENNKQNILKQKEKYYQENKEKLKKKKNEYYQKHKKEILKNKKFYNQSHKKERNNYYNNKQKTDINFKLACNLRNRLRKALKNNQKVGSAVKDLGCSIPELKIYLELKFQKGMNWDNWGEWHIDHIKCLSSFDLTNRDEFLKANHYTNLQPMWAKENIRKKDKIW
jgi:hypothetical protein